MELLFNAPSLLIGLIGWAATAAVCVDSPRTTAAQRRVLIILGWLIWMIPAFNTLVRRGMLTADTATIACGGISVALTLVVSLSALRLKQR
jgi:hypothetical protein